MSACLGFRPENISINQKLQGHNRSLWRKRRGGGDLKTKKVEHEKCSKASRLPFGFRQRGFQSLVRLPFVSCQPATSSRQLRGVYWRQQPVRISHTLAPSSGVKEKRGKNLLERTIKLKRIFYIFNVFFVSFLSEWFCLLSAWAIQTTLTLWENKNFQTNLITAYATGCQQATISNNWTCVNMEEFCPTLLCRIISILLISFAWTAL